MVERTAGVDREVDTVKCRGNPPAAGNCLLQRRRVGRRFGSANARSEQLGHTWRAGDASQHGQAEIGAIDEHRRHVELGAGATERASDGARLPAAAVVEDLAVGDDRDAGVARLEAQRTTAAATVLGQGHAVRTGHLGQGVVEQRGRLVRIGDTHERRELAVNWEHRDRHRQHRNGGGEHGHGRPMRPTVEVGRGLFQGFDPERLRRVGIAEQAQGHDHRVATLERRTTPHHAVAVWLEQRLPGLAGQYSDTECVAEGGCHRSAVERGTQPGEGGEERVTVPEVETSLRWRRCASPHRVSM